MRKQFVETVTQLFETDPNIALLLGDIGVHGFKQLIEKYPYRAFNLGVCEQSMVSVAAGLSSIDIIPIVHTIAPFLVERAYEQLKVDFGYQDLPGNFVSVGASFDYHAMGATHHCPADIGVLKYIPGMEIVVPGTAKEFDILFRAMYSNNQPTYYRLGEYVNANSATVEPYRMLPLRGNSRKSFSILAIGPALQWVYDSGILLEYPEANLLYCTTVSPFDCDTLWEYCYNNRILLVEPYYEGGLLREILCCSMHLVLVKCVGVPFYFKDGYASWENSSMYSQIIEALKIYAKCLNEGL